MKQLIYFFGLGRKERIFTLSDPIILLIHGFLSAKAYWSLNIPKERVQKAIENSLCFGVYQKLPV